MYHLESPGQEVDQRLLLRHQGNRVAVAGTGEGGRGGRGGRMQNVAGTAGGAELVDGGNGPNAGKVNRSDHPSKALQSRWRTLIDGSPVCC